VDRAFTHTSSPRGKAGNLFLHVVSSHVVLLDDLQPHRLVPDTQDLLLHNHFHSKCDFHTEVFFLQKVRPLHHFYLFAQIVNKKRKIISGGQVTFIK
jgi:hypothetical protein